jgi:hypothetical protein
MTGMETLLFGRGRGFMILTGFLLLGLACSSGPVPELNPSSGSDEILLQLTCEKNLSYLRVLIADKQANNNIPAFRIIEAQEIFRSAEFLYLQQEYELATELIENAIEILEGSGD